MAVQGVLVNVLLVLAEVLQVPAVVRAVAVATRNTLAVLVLGVIQAQAVEEEVLLLTVGLAQAAVLEVEVEVTAYL